MCYDAWQTVRTFSFVTLEGMVSEVAILLTFCWSELLWYPSAAHTAIAFVDIFQTLGCERMSASSQLLQRYTSVCQHHFVVIDIHVWCWWRATFDFIHDTWPFVKPQHQLDTCWTDITSASHKATVSTDVHGSCVWYPHEPHNTVHLFPCLLVQQDHQFSTDTALSLNSCAGEDTCHLTVGPFNTVQQNNSLLLWFFSHEWNEETYLLTDPCIKPLWGNVIQGPLQVMCSLY